jgi:hypothetical protein
VVVYPVDVEVLIAHARWNSRYRSLSRDECRTYFRRDECPILPDRAPWRISHNQRSALRGLRVSVAVRDLFDAGLSIEYERLALWQVLMSLGRI